MTPRASPYQTPRCHRLGTVQELTQLSNQVNADLPMGNNNTAFPTAS